MSWYSAPVRTNCALAPIFIAASAAKLDTCIECWNVPGHISDNCLRIGELISDSSTNVTFDTKPNVFSNK